MKKVLVNPEKDNNQYLENLYNCISKFKCLEIEKIPIVNFDLMRKGYKVYDFAIVSWLENVLVSPKVNKLTLVSVLKFFTKLLILKYVSKRIIYIRHNVYPHSLTKVHAFIAKKLIDFATFTSYKRVAHSGHLGTKYVYVPHPLYRFSNRLQTSDFPVSKPYFVVFGRIIEYKGILELLESWKDLPLLITGSVGSKEYLDKLNKVKVDKKLESVTFDARFLSDLEAQKAVENSLGIILCHAEKDMIVSGSFFFAASLGVPIFALKTEFLQWLKTIYNYPDLYIFDSLEELIYFLSSFSDQTFKNREFNLLKANELFGEFEVHKSLESLFLNSDLKR